MTQKVLLFFLLFFSISNYIHSQCIPKPGTEAIKDGGFEAGGDASTSYGPHNLYTPTPGGYSNPGVYYIGNDPTKLNYGLPGVNVRPYTGTNMLMVDASTSLDPVFFEQTVPIFSGQTYFFSCMITSLSELERCNLVFQVKGNNDASWTSLGPAIKAPDVGVWQQVYESWLSGTNTQTTIRIVNIHPVNYGYAGNDYAVDDISFKNACPKINKGPKPNLGPDIISLCNNGGSIDLNSQVNGIAPTDITWFKDNVALGNKLPILSNVTQTGNYVVCVDSNSCLNQDTIKVVATLFVDLGPDLELCTPSSITLSTGITASNNFQIIWKKDGVELASETSPTLFVNSPGEYIVQVIDKAGGNCNGSDTVKFTSKLAIPNNATFCPTTTTSATLSVTGSGKYKWWTAATGGNVVGHGSTYTATGLTGTTTFYVEDTTLVPAFASLKNDNTWTGNGGATKNRNNVAGQNFLNFTANEDAKIDTISVKMEFYNTAGGPGIATLTDNTSTTSQTKNFTISYPGAGEKYVEVPLNFQLIKGHKYTITVFGNDAWCATMRYYDPTKTFMKYPVNYGPVTFTGGQDPNAFEGLFNWRLSLPPQCSRLPVVATAYCDILCVPPANPTLTPPGPISVCKGSTFNQVITATISNPGAATFQYEFYNGNAIVQAASATNTYTVTQAGSYKVIVSDVANPSKCKATTSLIDFTIDSLPHVDTVVTAESCTGKGDGKVVLNPIGNTPFTYSWNTTPVQNSAAAINLTGGTYVCVFTDSKGCTNDISVTVPTLTLTASAIATNVKCFGNADGTVSLTVNGSNPMYTYLWSNGASTKDLTNLPKGNYSVTVTDSKGCTALSTATVNEPLAPVVATFTKNDVNCKGDAKGSILLSSVTGGTPNPNYSFLWNDNTTGQNLTNIKAGIYEVIVKDQFGCSDTNSFVITEPAVSLVINAKSTNVSCTAQGEIIANGSGGTGALEYSKDAITFTPSGTFSNLTAGNYTITIKDSKACTKDSIVRVGSDITPPTITKDKSSACEGDSITLTANPTGIDYLWTPGNEKTQSIKVKASGNYSVLVTITNLCPPQGANTDVVFDPIPVVDLGPDTMLVCPNKPIELGITPAVGNTYSWTSTTKFNSSQAQVKVATSGINSYFLKVSRNGCSASDTITLNIYEPPTLYIPNAFSPNNDTKNDLFKIEGERLKTVNASIFNSWGELLYEWETKDGTWDGTVMNKQVQEGVYIYNIKTTDICGLENSNRTGIITLVR